MLYDEKHHQFCEYRNGHGHGYVSQGKGYANDITCSFSIVAYIASFVEYNSQWRAPEEFADEGLSSKIDVYSLGK